MKNLQLDGYSLKIEDLYKTVKSYNKIPISFSKSAIKAIKLSRKVVDEWTKSGEIIYGITTGFGEFSNIKISLSDIEKLQENLILSHSAGVGEPLPLDVIRAMIILRLNALSKGYSGIRYETLEFIKNFFNSGITPIIPSKGSVGSSGDLIPLSHMTLSFLGKGKVLYQDVLMDASLALKKAKLNPLKLQAKEGLALINGTQMMTAYAALIVYEAIQLCKIADISAAMSFEALKGTDTAFDKRIHNLRPHKGQMESAENLRRLISGSEIRESHRFNDPRVQDAYSLRCIPQVHGATRDAVRYAYDIIQTEINSVTDNPIIFAKEKVHLEGGNFHGQPIAFVLDFLAIAISELANIAERRIERMLNGSLSGLPKFLTTRGGLNSGLMIAQYTTAALVSENKVLAHPASVDSIPTSANQEDHNSMGSISAQKCWQILKNVQTVIAIELLTAAQALDFSSFDIKTKKIMKPGKGTEAAYKFLRKHISHIHYDKTLYEEIEKTLNLVVDGSVLKATEKAIGKLK
ncbi:MAG: Histidine ammonia-lyase [Ignavibacteriae bacterium]|nr:MAG: Histidine ammonia-lyase [Ignavibacteriota bacterium]